MRESLDTDSALKEVQGKLPVELNDSESIKYTGEKIAYPQRCLINMKSLSKAMLRQLEAGLR